MGRALIVGSGGREHALVDALARAPSAPEIVAAPGNPGMRDKAECVEVAISDVEGLVALAEARQVDVVVVGPEAPLVAGLADALSARGIPVLGPRKAAAELEGSKAFAKSVMSEGHVPTADYAVFESPEPAIAFARRLGGRVVVKADGLAAGKGVRVAEDQADAEDAIRSILGGAFGAAGHAIVVEERLEGEELSVIALTDGETIDIFAPAQDHKRVGDGDQGPNTGGMGAYSPAPRGSPDLLREVEARCLRPIVDVMRRRGRPFSGFLYAGLMLTDAGPKVLEYNVRFGDPEAQAILARLESDAFDLFSAAARGRLSGVPVRFSRQAAVTVVLCAEGYPGEPKKGDVIEGLDVAARLAGVQVHHAGTQLVDGKVVTAGGRVLGVTGLGDDLLEAAETAYAAVRKIHFRGMHYRRDIAHRAIGRAVG